MTDGLEGRTAGFSPGTKYALIALNDGLRDGLGGSFSLEIDERFVITGRLPFELPDHWNDRLGRFRVTEIRASGVFLLALAPSTEPEVLNQENATLRSEVSRLYLGFLITAGPFHHREAFTATGAVHEDGVDVRQVIHLSPVFRTAGLPRRSLKSTHFQAASRIAANMESWESRGTHPRTKRVFSALYQGLRSQHVPERLHQFVRVLEGAFKTGRGKGRMQFRERFEDLAGAGQEELADRLYEIRGAVEHLRDPLEPISESPADQFLGRYTCIAESLARTVVQSLYLNERLSEFFETEESVDRLWQLTASERRKIWGPPADVKALSRGFDATEWNRLSSD